MYVSEMMQLFFQRNNYEVFVVPLVRKLLSLPTIEKLLSISERIHRAILVTLFTFFDQSKAVSFIGDQFSAEAKRET